MKVRLRTNLHTVLALLLSTVLLSFTGCHTNVGGDLRPTEDSSFLGAALGASSQESDSTKPYLPKSWFLTDSSTAPLSDPFPYEPTPQDPDALEKEKALQLERGIEELFRSQRMSLENINLSKTNVGTSDSQGDKPKDWVPWRLVTVIGELGLSAKGLLGILAFQGSPAVAVYWDKKEQRAFAPTGHNEQADFSQDASTFALTSDMQKEDIQQGLVPLMDGLMASGRISDRETLEKNLLDSVMEFQSAMYDVMASQRNVWYVSRFRLNLSVSASGVVSQGMSAGGELRVRLEWHRAQKVASPSRGRDLAHVKKSEKLVAFIQSLTLDLESLAISNSESSKFEAEQFRIGLGLSVGGDFGVVKGEAKVVGHIYFKRGAKNFAPTTVDSLSSDEPLYLITDGKLNQNEMMSLHRGSSEVSRSDRNGDGIIDEIVYKLDRKVFRKGLIFAGKMGGFFGKQAHKVSDAKWGVSKIKIDFDLSVGGDLGIVTLTGLVASQVEFVNKSF